MPEESGIRLLGVYFDRQLSFGKHLRNVAVRARHRLHFLRKCASFLDTNGRLTVYNGFLRPIMEYCLLVWIGATKTSLGQLDAVQRQAIHVIGQNTLLQSLSARRQVAALCFLYKLQALPASSPLRSMLLTLSNANHKQTLLVTRHQCSDRHRYQLCHALPAASRNSLLRTFPFGVLHDWNRLPASLLPKSPHLKGLPTFKSAVNRFLLRDDWLDDPSTELPLKSSACLSSSSAYRRSVASPDYRSEPLLQCSLRGNNLDVQIIKDVFSLFNEIRFEQNNSLGWLSKVPKSRILF